MDQEIREQDKEVMHRIVNTIYRFYLLTLVFILALFKRRFPKWLQKDARSALEPLPDLGKVEKYGR